MTLLQREKDVDVEDEDEIVAEDKGGKAPWLEI